MLIIAEAAIGHSTDTWKLEGYTDCSYSSLPSSLILYISVNNNISFLQVTYQVHLKSMGILKVLLVLKMCTQKGIKEGSGGIP